MINARIEETDKEENEKEEHKVEEKIHNLFLFTNILLKGQNRHLTKQIFSPTLSISDVTWSIKSEVKSLVMNNPSHI